MRQELFAWKWSSMSSSVHADFNFQVVFITQEKVVVVKSTKDNGGSIGKDSGKGEISL